MKEETVKQLDPTDPCGFKAAFDECYNVAIDHAIQIVEEESKLYSFNSNPVFQKLINSLTNLKKK